MRCLWRSLLLTDSMPLALAGGCCGVNRVNTFWGRVSCGGAASGAAAPPHRLSLHHLCRLVEASLPHSLTVSGAIDQKPMLGGSFCPSLQEDSQVAASRNLSVFGPEDQALIKAWGVTVAQENKLVAQFRSELEQATKLPPSVGERSCRWVRTP